MNLADIRSQVRTTSDLDTTELPNQFIDSFIREADTAIMARARNWPWLEQRWQFTTTNDDQTYDISSLAPATTTISEILSIVDETHAGFELIPIEHEFAEEAWRNSLMYSGVPTHWSQWAGVLYLWPKPSGARTLTVRSLRRSNDWVTTNDTIDMDERLHPALVLYSLARVYAFQEEASFSAQYMQMFERHVYNIMQEIFRNPQRTLVLGRGVHRIGNDAWARSLWRLSFP